MITGGFIALIFGALLGTRFNVLILVPVTLIGIAGGAVFCLATGLTPSWLAIALAILGLDLGYLASTAIRFVVAPALHLRRIPAPPIVSKSAPNSMVYPTRS
jgi:ABC-type uncharacterized transport system permease subunit